MAPPSTQSSTRLNMLKASMAERKAEKRRLQESKTLSHSMSVPSKLSINTQIDPAEHVDAPKSPIVDMLASGRHSPDDLLGPMGGFKTLAHSTSAKDLVRSRSYDETSRVISSSSTQSQLLMGVQEAEGGKLAPVERIGSIYTPTAAPLTMSVARRIQDISLRASPVSSSTRQKQRKAVTVTAPAAYELGVMLRADASQADDEEFDRGWEER